MNQPATSTDVWNQLVAASRKRTGGLYTRFINRRAAIPVTYLLWRTGVHPNTVSVIGFLTTHAAFVLLIILGPTLAISIVAYLLLVLGYIFDSCDGQLARVSGRTSPLGEWLDHSLDMVKILTFNMTLGYVMVTSAVAEERSLALPFAAAAVNLLSQAAHFYVISMREKILPPAAPQGAASQPVGGRARFLRHILDYGLLIMIVLLLPWQQVMVPVYFVYGCFFLLIATAYFAQTCVSIRRAGNSRGQRAGATD